MGQTIRVGMKKNWAKKTMKRMMGEEEEVYEETGGVGSNSRSEGIFFFFEEKFSKVIHLWEKIENGSDTMKIKKNCIFMV